MGQVPTLADRRPPPPGRRHHRPQTSLPRLLADLGGHFGWAANDHGDRPDHRRRRRCLRLSDRLPPEQPPCTCNFSGAYINLRSPRAASPSALRSPPASPVTPRRRLPSHRQPPRLLRTRHLDRRPRRPLRQGRKPHLHPKPHPRRRRLPRHHHPERTRRQDTSPASLPRLLADLGGHFGWAANDPLPIDHASTVRGDPHGSFVLDLDAVAHRWRCTTIAGTFCRSVRCRKAATRRSIGCLRGRGRCSHAARRRASTVARSGRARLAQLLPGSAHRGR